ncbi:sensor histidine kinase [Paenibacillus wynnii]|nr:histidine kinase [Paenibacillus wynnii]
MSFRSVFHVLINNISIRTRLLTYFLSMVLVPSTLIIITLYNTSSSTINNNMKNSIERNMTMMELNLTKSVEEIDNTTTSIYLNPDLQDVLSSSTPPDDYGLIDEMTRLNSLLGNYSTNERTGKKFQLKLYLMDRSEYSRFSFIGNVFTIESIQNEDWFQSIPYKEKYKVLGLYRNGDSKDSYSIRFVKRIYGLDDPSLSFAGVLTADVSINDFNETLVTMKPSSNSSVYLLNKNREVMVGSNRIAENDTFMRKMNLDSLALGDGGNFTASVLPINGVSTLVASKKIPELDWEIVTLSPMSDLNGPLVSFRKVMVLVMLVSLLLTLLLSFLLSNSITNPIRKFIKLIGKAEEDLYSVPMEYKRNDEFSYLFQRFNQMVQRTRNLIDKLYVSEVNKKKAEIEALQAQINPHFLYNTLDSINWMALKHQAGDISQMVTSLSDFFRLSLNKGRSIIKLEDELNQVIAYLTIQKIKMNQKLFYNIHVPAEVYPYLTVKLLLQPLVENAILHGFDQSNGRGEIHIQGSLENGRILIKVIDNGSGNHEIVAKINDMLLTDNETNTSFGIRNVNARIKQWFGDDFGLSYQANEEAGLTATICIPATKTMEGM